MQVTRQQILNGAANYVRTEMIPHVPDKGFRVILEALAAMVQMSPKAVDSFFENPMLSAGGSTTRPACLYDIVCRTLSQRTNLSIVMNKFIFFQFILSTR